MCERAPSFGSSNKPQFIQSTRKRSAHLDQRSSCCAAKFFVALGVTSAFSLIDTHTRQARWDVSATTTRGVDTGIRKYARPSFADRPDKCNTSHFHSRVPSPSSARIWKKNDDAVVDNDVDAEEELFAVDEAFLTSSARTTEESLPTATPRTPSSPVPPPYFQARGSPQQRQYESTALSWVDPYRLQSSYKIDASEVCN